MITLLKIMGQQNGISSWEKCNSFQDMLVMGKKWMLNEIRDYPGYRLNHNKTMDYPVDNFPSGSECIKHYLLAYQKKFLTRLFGPGDQYQSGKYFYKTCAYVVGFMEKKDALKVFNIFKDLDDIFITIADATNIMSNKELDHRAIVQAPHDEKGMIKYYLERTDKISEFVRLNRNYTFMDFDSLKALCKYLGEDSSELIKRMEMADNYNDKRTIYIEYISPAFGTLSAGRSALNYFKKKNMNVIGITDELYEKIKDDIMEVTICDMKWTRNDYLWDHLLSALDLEKVETDNEV